MSVLRRPVMRVLALPATGSVAVCGPATRPGGWCRVMVTACWWRCRPGGPSGSSASPADPGLVIAVLRNYTRWRQADSGLLHADILGARLTIEVDPEQVTVTVGDAVLSPDEARMIGVRLIDAAVLADGDRAIRRPATV